MAISTAGEIMDSAAALLNDVQKQVYTYTNQFPYLKIALKDFRELAELNNVPVTNKTSAFLTVPAGTILISFLTTPTLPVELVEIQQLWESSVSAGPYVPMTKKEFLPHGFDGISVSSFSYWAWQDNGIQLPPATGIIYLKIDYISTVFSTVVDQNSTIGVINADSFLHYRTAALCARYIDENTTRADHLDIQTGLALDRVLGIESKASQSIVTRRRPFRANIKSRSW